jgi:hypothetical protein
MLDRLYAELADGDLKLVKLVEAHREALRAACAADPDIWSIYASSFGPDHFDATFTALLGIADSLVELKAVCHCGRKATMNLRVDASGEAVSEGAQTEIGGNDRYVALCRRHFSEALGRTT